MMSLKRTLTALALALPLLASTATALADDPAEAFPQPEDYLMTPPNARAAKARVQAEAERFQAAHPITIQDATHLSATSSAAAVTVSASSSSTTPLGIQKNPSELDPMVARLLERLIRNKDHAQAIHSGAPLTPSGPEGTLTVVVMLFAVGVTLWQAERKEKWGWGFWK